MGPEKKKVLVNFKNPEGKMILKTMGKNATKNALKIMQAFDDACREIREKTGNEHSDTEAIMEFIYKYRNDENFFNFFKSLANQLGHVPKEDIIKDLTPFIVSIDGMMGMMTHLKDIDERDIKNYLRGLKESINKLIKKYEKKDVIKK